MIIRSYCFTYELISIVSFVPKKNLIYSLSNLFLKTIYKKFILSSSNYFLIPFLEAYSSTEVNIYGKFVVE